MVLINFVFRIFLFTLTVGAIYLSGPSLSLVLSRIKDGVFFGCNLRPRLINSVGTHHISTFLVVTNIMFTVNTILKHFMFFTHSHSLQNSWFFRKIYSKCLLLWLFSQPFFCWPTVCESGRLAVCIFSLWIRQRRRNRVIIWWKYFSFIRSHWTNVKILQYPHMALSV